MPDVLLRERFPRHCPCSGEWGERGKRRFDDPSTYTRAAGEGQPRETLLKYVALYCQWGPTCCRSTVTPTPILRRRRTIATLVTGQPPTVIHPKDLAVGEIVTTTNRDLRAKTIFRVSLDTFLVIERDDSVSAFSEKQISRWGESSEAYTKLPKGTTITLTF